MAAFSMFSNFFQAGTKTLIAYSVKCPLWLCEVSKIAMFTLFGDRNYKAAAALHLCHCLNVKSLVNQAYSILKCHILL